MSPRSIPRPPKREGANRPAAGGVGLGTRKGDAGVQDRLKDFIARHVFHPLEGMTLGDWWSLLRRHRFAIDPQHWPRALVQTAVSALQLGQRPVRAAALRATDRCDPAPAPAVHPRALPQRHDAPAQPAGPRPAVRHPDLLPDPQPAHLPDHRAVGRPGRRHGSSSGGATRTRWPWAPACPTEDEFALGTMTGLSPYLGWYFPSGLPTTTAT